MPLSPVPTRTILPKTEALHCPETVRQTVNSTYIQGTAMVSPDNSPRDESSASSRILTAKPKSTGPPQDPFEIAREAVDMAASLAPLAPRTGKYQVNGDSHLSDFLSDRMSHPLSNFNFNYNTVFTSSEPMTEPNKPSASASSVLPRLTPNGLRLNKFVRRLHDMLQAEKKTGIVEWRRGLLVLHSTDAFARMILPKYFNTRNFKTFRRQLNYYGFVHVRSFSTTGSTTTALWVNRDLANRGTDEISSVLMLKRVEPSDDAKTAEGRRVRKELAIYTVEEDIGVSPKSLQMDQIRNMTTEVSHFQRQVPIAPQIPVQFSSRTATSPLPKLAQKPISSAEVQTQETTNFTGEVSRSSSLALSTSQSQASNDSSNNQQSQSSDSDEAVDSDPEESAASLLLMLSKGPAKKKN